MSSVHSFLTRPQHAQDLTSISLDCTRCKCELATSDSRQPPPCYQVIGGTAKAALPANALTVWPASVARSIPRFAGRAGAEAAPSRLTASNRRKDAGSHGPHRHSCVVVTRQATFCGPGRWRVFLAVPWKQQPWGGSSPELCRHFGYR